MPEMTDASSAKRGRRGDLTRKRILESSIACITRSGYSGTSVEAIMADASLSRGSVLHQFPTRLQLTLSTAEFAMDQMLASGAALGAAISDPIERFCGHADIVWEVYLTPASTALTDILLASRWDDALSAGLKPLAEIVERRVDDHYANLARQAGATDIERAVLHGRLLNASVRGLTVELTFNPSRDLVLSALETLKRDYRLFCESLVGAKKQAKVGRFSP